MADARVARAQAKVDESRAAEAVARTIDPFTDTPAKMITMESSLAILTFPPYTQALEVAGGRAKNIIFFESNKLLAIWSGDGKEREYTKVWDSKIPALNKHLGRSINLQTLHLQFKNDILDPKLRMFKQILNMQIFYKSITYIRRPGDAVGEVSQAIIPTSAAEQAIIDKSTQLGRALITASKATAKATASAAKAAAKAASNKAVSMQKQVASSIAARRAAQAHAKEGTVTPISAAESPSAMPPSMKDGKLTLIYNVQTTGDGTFYADVMTPDGQRYRITALNKNVLSKAVQKFAAGKNYDSFEKEASNSNANNSNGNPLGRIQINSNAPANANDPKAPPNLKARANANDPQAADNSNNSNGNPLRRIQINN